MRHLVQISAWILLAVWLPATLHCNLLAAGIIKSIDHADSCSAGDDKADLCATVETVLIKESAPTFDFTSAIAAELSGYLDVSAISPSENRSEFTLVRSGQSPPLEIEAAWHFLTRAAPPSRAPSLLSA